MKKTETMVFYKFIQVFLSTLVLAVCVMTLRFWSSVIHRMTEARLTMELDEIEHLKTRKSVRNQSGFLLLSVAYLFQCSRPINETRLVKRYREISPVS